MSEQTNVFREERGVSPCLLDDLERAIFIEWRGDKARIFRPHLVNEFRDNFFFEVDDDRVKLVDEWKVCLFDTERRGPPKKFSAPISDVENWPRMVELAFSVSSFDFKTGEKKGEKIFNLIVDPQDFEIPESSTKGQGITQEQAEIEGLPIIFCLEKMTQCWREVRRPSTYLNRYILDLDGLLLKEINFSKQTSQYLQWQNPDIFELNRIVMVLQQDATFFHFFPGKPASGRMWYLRFILN